MFETAVERYLGGASAVLDTIEQAGSARSAAHNLLVAAATGDTGEATPPGCLLASSIVSSSPATADVREHVAHIRRGIETALRSRIERDVADGILPSTSNAETLAGHVFAVVQGMSTLAKDGADRRKLMNIVEQTMVGWPQA